MGTLQDRRIDELYGAPLSEFVERRNRLAAELRDTGRRAEAIQVKRLRKPSVPVWTINRLARQDAAAVNKFIETVTRLRRAHLREPRGVPEATASQRAALNSLLHRAEEIMAAADLEASPAMQQRISDTLLGAAADRHLQQDLRQGRLAEEQKAPGFEILEGARLRAIPGGRRGPDLARGQPKERHTTEQPRRRAQAEVRHKQGQARKLEQTVARRRRAADSAATRAQALRRELQALVQKEASERAAADEAARQARRLRED